MQELTVDIDSQDATVKSGVEALDTIDEILSPLFGQCQHQSPYSIPTPIHTLI